MFDHYTIRAGDTHHSHTHSITEKRAPTDESVRLLREMETKAKEQVIAAVQVIDNSFNIVVHAHHDNLYMNIIIMMVYSINGKRHESKFTLNPMKKKEQWIPELVECLGKDIARLVLAEPMGKVMREMRL